MTVPRPSSQWVGCPLCTLIIQCNATWHGCLLADVIELAVCVELCSGAVLAKDWMCQCRDMQALTLPVLVAVCDTCLHNMCCSNTFVCSICWEPYEPWHFNFHVKYHFNTFFTCQSMLVCPAKKRSLSCCKSAVCVCWLSSVWVWSDGTMVWLRAFNLHRQGNLCPVWMCLHALLRIMFVSSDMSDISLTEP